MMNNPPSGFFQAPQAAAPRQSNYLDRLRQAMEFYDKEGLGGPLASFDSDPNRANRRSMWAERMVGNMGGGGGDAAPEFFGAQGQQQGGQAAYQQPAPFAYDAVRDTPPPREMAQGPMRQPINNYLAQLLGRR